MTPNQKIGTVAAMGAAVIALAAPFVRSQEGEVLHGYQDLGGVATACSGHTKTATLGRAYTRDECRVLLSQDLAAHAALIRPCVPAGTPIESQAGFLSLSFNIGGAAFCRSTVARRLQTGDLAGACDAMMMWVKVNGRVVQGLVNRRVKERLLCRQGLTPTAPV